jgi:hypothetical protein
MSVPGATYAFSLRPLSAPLRDLFLAVDPRSSEARAVAIRTDL